MTFEQAITALKQGKKVRRVAWESDDKYPRFIELVKDYDNPLSPYFRMIDKDNYLYGTNVMSVHDDDVMADDWEIAEDEAKPPIESVSTKDLIAELRKRNNVIIKEVQPNTASTFVVNGYDGGKIVFTITEKTDN